MECFRMMNFRKVLILLLAVQFLAVGISFSADLSKCQTTCSSIHSEPYQPQYAIDAKSDTRWASARFQDKPEWLQVDFGRQLPVKYLTIQWEHAYAIEYQVQVSDDAQNWKTLHHEKNGKDEKKTLENLAGEGRYLRILCIKPCQFNLFSIWEIELLDESVAENKKKAVEKLETVRKDLGFDEIIFSARENGKDGHWYANFSYYSFDENKKLYGCEGRLCKFNLKTGTMTTILEDKEGVIRDPAVHYDAQKIIFSWRKAGTDVFHLYEINVNGSNLKQLTDGIFDDIEPCYLPDGNIMFVSARAKRWVNCWLTQVAILYQCDASGNNIRQISANIEHDNTPWPLNDGRIIYQRWEYVDRSQVHYHHLWTANPDGTGQMVYYGNLHPGGLYIDAKPIPDSDKVVFINSPGHGRGEHEGHVAIVTDRFGPDDKSALRNITREANFRDPWPISEDLFIVASGKNLLLMDSQGTSLVMYTLPAEFGGANLQEPRPLVKRARERAIPSRVNLSKATGQLILADVYYGRNMAGVENGKIKKLLVLESLPKPINYTGGMDPLTYGGSFTLERIVGTVPIEPDGSAFMELPANRAFFFVALDENNNSVKRMQSFLSLAPGEVTSCVGCHEERGKTPVNNARMGRLQALKRAPSIPEPVKNVPEVFDFPRDIQPILDKHCLKCHDVDKRKGGVLLTGDRSPMFSLSYATLTIKHQVADGRNYAKSNYSPGALGATASPLMKKINGEHHDVKVSPQEQEMIRYWIESAAVYPGTYAALGCGGIGGYLQNNQIHKDDNWPTLKPFQEALDRRCVGCHNEQLKLPMPHSLSDEIGLSFWSPDWNDVRFRFSRHTMFNLTRPDKSALLMAALSKEAGGHGLCKKSINKDAESVVVFANTSDPDYQAMLKHIEAGKQHLETEAIRFDMPNFKPLPGYVREMKRYGILPATFDLEKDSIDVYETDRLYWKSLWWVPEGSKR